MANIPSFPFIVQITGDNSSLSVVVGLGYTPTTATLVAAYDANANSVSANIGSVVPGSSNVTINFVSAFSGTIQVLLALGNSTYANAPLHPVTGTFWQTTQPVSIATMPSTPVTGTFWQTTQPVSGTITANQGTSPWVVSLASTTITGTVAVDGALTNNNAAPAATLLGVLPALAETAYATVTYTTGDMVLPVTDLHGALNQDLQAVAGTALGTPTAFGTTPGAVVAISANASLFVGTTVAVASSAGVQKVGIAGGAAGASIDSAINGAASTNALWTMNAPSTAAAAALATPTTVAALSVSNVKASAGNVFGLAVNNTSSTPVFIQFYNTAGTPTLGTGVVFSIPCAIGVTTLAMSPIALANFTTGIGIGASTSALSTGTPSVAPTVTIFYK